MNRSQYFALVVLSFSPALVARGQDVTHDPLIRPGNGPIEAIPAIPKVTLNTLSRTAQTKVDLIVTRFMSANKTPGIELSIQKGGVTVYECGYGSIAQGSAVYPGPNTRFQIDSLTKSFTAFAVLRLAEEGKVDLNATMGSYISLPNPGWKTIPVRQFLGMVTGIPDGGTTTGSYKQVIASAAARKTPFGVGLDFEPGSKYEYSNPNYFILGDLVSERSPQKTFMAYTKAEILTPLGMTNTGFFSSGTGNLWPTPYNNGQPIKPRDPMSGFSGGGFTSTMKDLERFAIGLYDKGVLSVQSYKQMWTPTVLTSGPNKGKSVAFGLGWDVMLGPKGDLIRASKNGGGWGWGAQLSFFPATGDSTIMLRNSSGTGAMGPVNANIEKALAGG